MSEGGRAQCSRMADPTAAAQPARARPRGARTDRRDPRAQRWLSCHPQRAPGGGQHAHPLRAGRSAEPAGHQGRGAHPALD